jgi:hypothetical protein
MHLMHGSAERRTGLYQSEVVLYNQTNGLRSINRLAHEAPWSVYTLRTSVCQLSTNLIIWRVRPCQSILFLDQYYIIIIIILYMIWFQLNWAIKITYLSVFSVNDHIWVWILFYFYSIILFSRLIWDLGMFEGLSLLAPGWYKESPICIIFYFVIS